MVMKALREGAAGGVMKFIIFGFLLMAVGGMVFMDIGVFFRSGGVGSNDVAKIGPDKISLPSFDHTLRRSLSQLGIGPQDAYKAGYVDQLLAGEIQTHLMAQAAADLGIFVDKRRVAEQIRMLLGPMVKEGQDPREVLRQVLMNQGMSEGELTRAISQEITIGLLTNTIKAGFAAGNEQVAKDLFAFENETRDLVYVPFLDNDVKSILEPSDEQLRSLYEVMKDVAYSSEEARKLQIVRLKTDNMKKSIQVDEDEIRKAYDDNIELYSEKE